MPKKIDRNRQLQLSQAIAPVLDRIAARDDVFLEIDVFRNTKSENRVSRKSFIGWLRKSKMIEDCPDGYLILDRPGLSALASQMRSSPFAAMAKYLQYCYAMDRGDKDEEAETPGPEETGSPDVEEVEEENVPDEIPEETTEDEREELYGDPPDEGTSDRPVLVGRPEIAATLRELDRMTSEANTKNRARFVLSISALAVFLSRVPDGEFSTRKDLFKIPNLPHDKCLANEAMAKAWQKAFLDRTEEIGLTEKTISGRDNVYRIADGKTDAVIMMVSEAVHDGGQSLRRILWPGQYGQEEEGEEDAAEEQAQSEGQKGAVEVLSELVGQLTAVADSMGHVHRSMESVLSRLTEIGDQGKTREEKAEAFLEGIQKSLSSIVSRLDSEDRGALASIKDRLAEIQARRKSLSNQLEAEAAREEKLLEELRSALGAKG